MVAVYGWWSPTYGVISQGVFAESLRKFDGKIRRNLKNTFDCVRNSGCRNSAESLRKFRGKLRKVSAMTPSRTTPISELLISRVSGAKPLFLWTEFPFVIFRKNRLGGFRNFEGGASCNNRFVLKPDIAIASEVSNSSKNSLATKDFFAKRTQLANYKHQRFPE